ncbi:hypothetical protein DCC77_02345 [Candidatus Uhrbacteria bacterium]|nr:MAG: hypothetical protein DCC77_02345 [Candidatus Uhrbacteria bacterium]
MTYDHLVRFAVCRHEFAVFDFQVFKNKGKHHPFVLEFVRTHALVNRFSVLYNLDHRDSHFVVLQVCV